MPGRTDSAQASDAPARRGVYLLTHPRSASNLFETMMAKQPGYQSSAYKLFGAGFASLQLLQKGRMSEWPEEERKALYAAFQTGFEELQDELADAEKNGKQVFTKEHALFLLGPDKMFASAFKGDKVEPLVLKLRDGPESVHTNPSGLPDRFLLSMQPIFQIRHPVLMFPSMLRAQMQTETGTCPSDLRIQTTLTLRHSRALYDWYLEHGGELKPRVIDADDIMKDPAAVRQLCIETGLDPEAVQYEWEERSIEDPLKARFLSTINASKGIVAGLDARGLDIEIEKLKWKVEFGDKDGEDLAKFVYDALPDYEYLLSRRTRPAQADSPQE